MDLRPSSEQEQLVQAFDDLFDDFCSPETVLTAEPSGHSPELWTRLLGIGVVAMAVPEEQGGFGATLVDLALVAERYGRHVAPVPLVEAQVAARLLDAVPGGEAARALGRVLGADRLVTLALRPAAGGRAGLVPAGAVADDALLLIEDRLVLVDLADPAAARTPIRNLGCLPLADVAVGSAATVLWAGPAAVSAYAAAVDEWRILTAAALNGLSARALEIALAYVLERKAFGKVLGAFQTIAHRLADRATEIDGSQLLGREAAWSAAGDRDRLPVLAAMALAFAAETAGDTTQQALHFHGGYGFMLEYAIQLYYRRARTWGGVLENPATGYRLVADRQARAVAREAAQ